jgi:hypothetical protein
MELGALSIVLLKSICSLFMLHVRGDGRNNALHEGREHMRDSGNGCRALRQDLRG